MSRPEAAAGAIYAALDGVEGIRSVTLVGSFVDRPDPGGASDIDTVVIFDRLTPSRVTHAVSAVGALTGDALGFPGHTVSVNSTFGPLKFDEPGRIVVHLMLYDRASHRQHVLRSPFTCFDWQRSRICRGARLADLYPVGCLAPADFLTARRGLADYITDLESGTLSVRRLAPDGDAMVEVSDRVRLDRRHQGEFAFHIIRHLVVNLLKMRTGRNQSWDEARLCRDWCDLPDLAGSLPFYERIRDVKIARRDDFPPDTLARARAFVDAFQVSFARALDRAFRLRLVPIQVEEFQRGETTEDVVRRARVFLESRSRASGRALAVTDIAVARAIVAHLLGFDVRQAGRIPIGPLEPIDICRIGDRWLPDWDAAVKARLID